MLRALRVHASCKSATRLALVRTLLHLTQHGGAFMNNITTLIGRIGQDPRSVTFPDSDNKVVKFSVGVKEFSSNKDEDSTLWIDVDAWKD